MDADLLTNLLRTIGFFLDNIVYNLIPTIYQLFIYLSGIDIVNNSDQIGALIQRIYVLLGIFMLFKVSFSLIQYIVDPSAFGDKSKGFGKLITNVLVAMVLLVSVPSIFSFAMNLQQTVLESNVIGKLILGTGSSEPVSTQIDTANTNNITAANAEVMAKDVQFMMFGAFYSLNTDISQFKDACGDDTIFGSSAMAANRSCIETLSTAIQEYDETQARGIILDDFFKTRDLDTGVVSDRRDFYAFDSMLWWEEDGDYVINYLPLVSTFAGIFVVFLLTSFSIEVAVRVIKLAFLQMIAPIAIVSYIDPKETIGNGKLNGWIKESVKTYFSLFLRLATIFLVMLLISVLASTVLADGSELAGQINDTDYNIWIYLFLIIGAFMFAKQVPNMIESIFGIKGSGEFSLNPFKSIKENVLANPMIAAGIGGAAGSIATGVGAFTTSKSMGRGNIRSLFSAAGGMGVGLGRGLKAGAFSKGDHIVSKATGTVGNTTRNMALRDTTKAKDRIGAQFRMATGMQSKLEALEGKAKMYDSVKGYADAMKDRAKEEMGKKDDRWKLIQATRNQLNQRFNDGKVSPADYTRQLQILQGQEDDMVEKYIDTGGILNGVLQRDGEVAANRKALDRVIQENKLEYDTSNWKNIKDAKGKAEDAARDIRTSDPYENAKAVDEAQKSGILQQHFGGGNKH